MNTNRIKKVAAGILGTGVLLSAGFFAGKSMEQKQQEQKQQSEEHVNMIAIVNMDEGIAKGEEQVNYASQLMQLPGDNYITTGLNEAKYGITNGAYAAYIVIPENFSEAVSSVESNPQKILLEYAFNQMLDEETEQQAIYDVNAFETTLNTNIAYMYLDAILTAFHGVQDDTSTILSNDAAELSQLQNVNAGQLVASLEWPELQQLPAGITAVDMSPHLAENETLLDVMVQEYETSLQQGIDGFGNVQDGHMAVDTASDTFFVTYGTVLADTAVNNSRILADGKTNLEESISVFNNNLQEDTETIKEGITGVVENQRQADEASANQQLDSILEQVSEENSEKLNQLQQEWRNAYSVWNDYVQKSVAENGTALLEEYQNKIDDNISAIAAAAYKQGAAEALASVTEAVSSDSGSGDGGDGSTDGGDGSGSGGDGSTDSGDGSGSGGDGSTDSGDGEDGSADSGDGSGADGGVDSKSTQLGSTEKVCSTGTEVPDTSGSGGSGDGGSGDNGSGDGGNGDSGSGDGGSGDGGDTTPKEDTFSSSEIEQICTGLLDDVENQADDYSKNPDNNIKIELSEESLQLLSICLDDATDENGVKVEQPEIPEKDDTSEMEIAVETDENANADVVTRMTADITALFALQEDRQVISEQIQSDFVETLAKEGQTQMGRLRETEQTLSSVMAEYERSLTAYDPFQYMNRTKLESYLKDIGSNSAEMLKEVEQNNTEYVKYADEVYTAASENMGDMQSALGEANTQTAGNVESCMDELKSARAEINSKNTDMLQTFTGLLPYTRVGSQGNPESYEHIVNPVVAVGNGSDIVVQGNQENRPSTSVSNILEIVLMAGIVICILAAASIVLRRAKSPKEAEET